MIIILLDARFAFGAFQRHESSHNHPPPPPIRIIINVVVLGRVRRIYMRRHVIITIINGITIHL